jgi:RNA polymerase sigma-70 factor (ECF subfamily)
MINDFVNFRTNEFIIRNVILRAGEEMLSDKQLVELYRSGHQESLTCLIEVYRDDLYKFCRHLTLNLQDAEDLFQEVWMRVIRKLEMYDPERPFKNWLFKVTFNIYQDRYRKWKKVYRLLTMEGSLFNTPIARIEDTAPPVEDRLLKDERFGQLEQCLRKLPKKYLTPLILYYYDDFSYESIAEMLAIPMGTVKSRLNQGKKLLATNMRGVDKNDE